MGLKTAMIHLLYFCKYMFFMILDSEPTTVYGQPFRRRAGVYQQGYTGH